MIVNFDKFNHYIDGLFASGSVSDFASYRQALALSKDKRKAKIASISKQINALLKQIEQARVDIKQASSDDKKSQGQALNTYLQTKKSLVRQYNAAKNVTLFSELTTEAKIYACAKNLLLKYLPQELSKTPYLAMSKDSAGNLIFVPDKIEDTSLERDIHHIIDYVTSYLENYPEKVRGAKHFTGLHKKCTDMNELIEEIDAYFTKLNSPSEKEANRIKNSHSGFEVVMNMPEYGLQAVRLLTKPALKYEGAAMHHCVGSYASKVEKGETAIYSIRLTADENNEMIPVATMEYKDGKLTQIKGQHDSEISFTYLQGVRDFILHLTGKKNMAEIASDDTVKDKQNIGLIKDNTGVYRDIYTLIENENYVFDNIYIEASSLPYIPTDHLTVKNLTIHSRLKAEDLEHLSKISVQSTIRFRDLEFDGNHLDLANFANTTISLDFSKAPNLETITLSDKAESLKLFGEAPKLKDIIAPNLQRVTPEIIAPQLDFARLGLSNVKTMAIFVGNLTSHQIDLSNYNDLEELVFSTKTGTELHNLIVPSNLKTLCLTGQYPNLSISGVDNVQTLHVSGDLGSGNDKLDLSSFSALKEFKITLGNPSNWQQILLPEKLESFTALGEYQKLTSISGAPHLHKLDFEGIAPLLILSVNNWPELTDLTSISDYFASPDVNWQNCSQLNNISIHATKKGSNCHSLTLPDSVEHLYMYGNFSQLSRICLSYGLKELTIDGSFGLEELSLPDNLQSFSYNNKLEIPQIKFNPALQVISLSGKIPSINQFSFFPNLTNLELDGNIPNITSLNCKQICPHLQELNLMGAELKNLRELIASPDIIHICMNQAQFSQLELLDFSAIKLKTFGTLYNDVKIPSFKPQPNSDNSIVTNPPKIIGISCQEAFMPNLKQIKYPHDVETLDFSLTQFDPQKVVDFSAYPNLKTITTRDLKTIDMSKPTQPDTTAILTRRQAVNY